MISLAIVQFTLSLIVLLYAIRCLRSGLSSLLAFHVAAFISLVSFGVSIAPFIAVENLAYVSSPNIIPLVRNLSPSLYFKQCLSHWIFLGISFIALKWEMTWAQHKMRNIKPIGSATFWGYTAFFIGIALSVKYFLFGPGWTILRETRLVFFTTTEAISHRVSGYLAAGIGEGNYMASVAAFIFFPLSAAIISLRRKRTSWILFFSAFIISILYAYQTRQKAPLLCMLLTFFFLYYLSVKEKKRRDLLKGMFISTLLFGTVGTIALYMINFGQNLINSVQGFFFRVFFVPAASETNFFVIFSESLPFRGMMHIFSIPWGRFSSEEMVSIMDIGKMATGTAYSANASFLAVAWSGGGYLGVLVVSIFIVALLVALDRSLCLTHKNLFYIVMALSPIHLFTLVSDGVSVYFGRGGILVPLIIILLSRAPIISFKSHSSWK